MHRLALLRSAALALLLGHAACAPRAFLPACHESPDEHVPLTLREGFPVVPVQMNGQALPFLLDTGTSATILWPETAGRLGLPPDPRRSSINLGIGGAAEGPNALVRHFRFGGRDIERISLPVPRGSARPAPQAGLIGADLLRDRDLEFDLPGRRVLLRPPSPCRPLPGWDGAFERIDVRITPSGLVTLPVRIGGQTFQALLDTGAQRSVIKTPAARQAGAPEAVLEAVPVGTAFGVGPGQLPVRAWPDPPMQVGSETLRGMTLLVADLPEAVTGDLVLGLDYFATRRILLSYATQTLFVQPATPAP